MPDVSLQPILALLGDPVAANPTQYMMEKAFAHHQLDFRFLTLEVKAEHLADAIRGMRAMGFAGGTCADPHRQTVVPLLDRTTEVAGLTDVVNCIFREGEELVGDNTEGRGMLRALGGNVALEGKHVMILGAGKTARAVAVEAALAKAAQVDLVCRSLDAAAGLVETLAVKLQVPSRALAWEAPLEIPPEVQVLVNATSIGHNDPDARVPINPSSLRAELLVADVILDPPRTALISAARAAGCKTVDGLDLFLHQSALALKQWTGIDPDVVVMREAVEEFLLL